MNKKIVPIYLCLGLLLQINITHTYTSVLTDKLDSHTKHKQKKDATISFNFNNGDLVDIINMCAAHKDINIILPIGANAINEKVTLAIPGKLTDQEAWDILHIILDIAGYSLVPKADHYLIVKNSKNISRETFPIYINSPIDTLPPTDERIRYMFYLQNIKASQEFDNQLNALFKEFMPEDAILKADKTANSILIIGKSQDVKGFIHIIQNLDEIGFQEHLEVVSLRYTQADTIANLFSENLLKTAAATPANRYHLDAKKEPDATYFSSNVKVIAEPRTNSLIILGRSQAIDRIKDFVFKHIDKEPDSGKSILHIYELQYLDAEELAPVLRNIVESSRSGGTGQSTASGSAQNSTERFFDQVIIQPDSPAQASGEANQGQYFGGNKLVIAARNDDWKHIKSLIEQLDKPQPQVIIEVLIADLTLEDARTLGSLMRNPSNIPFAGNASFQAAMIDQVVLDSPSTDPAGVNALTSVASDLNAITVPSTSDSSVIVSVPNNVPPGTTMIALNDSNGRTWSLLQILELLSNSKVLSHPHIIATNNQKATIEVGETRLVIDQAAPSTSGITRRKTELKANTNVYLTPRISSADTVNLQVVIDIDQFTDPTNYQSGDRINRDVTTNSNVKNGDILALGGLISEETNDTVIRTPILGSIPIIGWFFKTKSKIISQTSLTIFISPTIIQPKLRGGVGKYTKAYTEMARDYSTSGLFDGLRDPITRWFFGSDTEAATITQNFLEKDEITEALRAESLEGVEAKDALPEEKSIPIDASTPLKQFLAKEENPLSKQINHSKTANKCDSRAPLQDPISRGNTLPSKKVNEKSPSSLLSNARSPNTTVTPCKQSKTRKQTLRKSKDIQERRNPNQKIDGFAQDAIQPLIVSHMHATKPTSPMDNLRKQLAQ